MAKNKPKGPIVPNVPPRNRRKPPNPMLYNSRRYKRAKTARNPRRKGTTDAGFKMILFLILASAFVLWLIVGFAPR